jgi:hypothetical protein
MEPELKPFAWCEQYGIEIMDPDGWRMANSPDWNTPIKREDFLFRMGISTIRIIDNELFRNASR